MGLWNDIVRRGTTGEVRQEDNNALRLQKHLEEMYSSYLDKNLPMMQIHYLADTDKGVASSL